MSREQLRKEIVQKYLLIMDLQHELKNLFNELDSL